MKLYYHPASTTSRIVMLFAAEEGIALDYQLVDLMTGEHLKAEYKALNPNCLVPMLDDDGFRLTESGAIIRYLASLSGSAAYPTELKARARVDEMLQWFYSNYYKDLGYGLVYPQVFPHHCRPNEATQAGTIDWGKRQAMHWLDILDQNLIGPDKPFLCGDRVTLADYAGVEMVALGELVHCTYQDYPNVRRWLANMKALPHWAEVHKVVDGFAASLKDKPFECI